MRKRDFVINPETMRNYTLMSDDFMSAYFDDNIECTELLLKGLTGKELTVQSVKAQYVIPNLRGRGIRLDIFAEDKVGTLYNIEVQRNKAGALARRARRNASLMDTSVADSGEYGEKLPETYVIFITDTDMFGAGLGLYTIRRKVEETGASFGDGQTIIYFNVNADQQNELLSSIAHDFKCRDHNEMQNGVFAASMNRMKNTEMGVTRMSEAMRKFADEIFAEGVEEGKEIGLEEGKEIGLEEGKEIGLEEGKEIGAKEKSIEIAQNLLNTTDLDVSVIAAVSNLPLEEVKALVAESCDK